jgi:hypothetical protein
MSRANVPAFTVATGEHFVAAQTHGLTIREHFAAMALSGLLANNGQFNRDIENQIALSVEYADHLLAELEKPR